MNVSDVALKSVQCLVLSTAPPVLSISYPAGGGGGGGAIGGLSF